MKIAMHIGLAGLEIVALITGAIPGHAQPNSSRRYPGAPIEELRRLAAKEDLDAIFQIGMRRDTASLPLLMKLCKPLYKSLPPETNSSLARRMELAALNKQVALSLEARRAVARMNIHPNISDYTSCLDDPNAYNKEPCISALGYIGDVKAVKHLGPLLSDKGTPPAFKP